MKAFILKAIRIVFSLFQSIRFRLTIWSIVILALVLTAFSGFIYTTQLQSLKSEATSQIIDDFSYFSHPYLIYAAQYINDGGTSLPNLSQTISNLRDSNQILVLLDSQGKVIDQLGLKDTPIFDTYLKNLASNGGKNSPFYYHFLAGTGESGNDDSKTYIMVMSAIQVGRGGNVLGYILVGDPLDPGNQMGHLLLALLIATGSILLLVMLCGYWLVGRALHPIQVITHTAQEIGETDLSRRLNLHTHDELGELANTFDRMLDRLQAAFIRQRQFTADASHELRTPLTIINLEADRALSHHRSATEYERSLSTIKAENEYMTRLVNDLLTLARMDAGQAKMKTEDVDFSDITLDVVERLAPIAHQKGVELCTGDLPEVPLLGDRQYLTQMVLNLVENAIKYSTNSEKRVFVETGITTEAQKELGWVRITDTGSGIPPEDLPHIFDRFYRVDKARARNATETTELPEGDAAPSGSGLGLSIVQWIATSHGGQVTVQSEPGRGSVFEVRIPLARPVDPDSD